MSSIGSISAASIGMQALSSLRAPGRSPEIKPVEKIVRREPPEDPFESAELREDEDSEQLLRDLGRSAPGPVIVEARQEAASVAEAKSAAGEALTQEERKEVDDLKQRDREVRQHEAAHQAAAGQHGGGPTFTYQTGPDGNRYAVGGEVSIDTSAVNGDPQATITKMQQIQRAAQAPAEPSSQDRQVAAQASQAEQKARAELAEQRRAEQSGEDETDEAASSRFAGGSTFADIYNAAIGALGEKSANESLNLVA
jgi:hypothetical protein